ncbi:hypothetical protein [Mesorhizobium sp. M3A.F.Ca.ET.080.04.2.1]|uniref:hypothetical protein n=1 Tax=Mesorhizobium sp. M3A.F.Ca.ET.080.04.2.1 TaxID=2493676 RepID=UPI0013EDE6BB|nr:hypothetical protein [Mesorhizobium sp. M3A.F.Ca.ET.080.04.2.1]
MSHAEMHRLPPRAAIVFALDRLQDWEVAEFLREWREGKPLGPWLAALEQDQQMAAA